MARDNPRDDRGSLHVPPRERAEAVGAIELAGLRQQRRGALPGALLVPQPEAERMAAVAVVVRGAVIIVAVIVVVVVVVVDEGVARVQQGQVVDELDVARPQADLQLVLGRGEVHRVERFGLPLGHGGHARRVRGGGAAGQGPAREAEAGAVRVEVVQEGPAVPAGWLDESVFYRLRVSCVLLGIGL